MVDGVFTTIKHQASAILPECDLSWVRGYVSYGRDQLDQLQFDDRGWVQDPETEEFEEAFQLLQGRHAQTGARYQVRWQDPFGEDDSPPRPVHAALLVTRRVGDLIEAQLNEMGASAREWQVDLRADLADLSAHGKATSPLRQLFPVEDVPGLGLLLSGRVDAEADLAASPLVQRCTGRLAMFKLRSRKVNVDASLTGHLTAAGTRLTVDLKLAGKGLGRLAIAIFRRRIEAAIKKGLAEGFNDQVLAKVAAQCDQFGAEWRAGPDASEGGFVGTPFGRG